MSYLVTLASRIPDELVAFAPFVLVGAIVAFFVAKSMVETISNGRSKREILRYHREQSLAAYEKGLSPPELPAEVLKDLNSVKNKRRKATGSLHGNLFWGVSLLIAASGLLYLNGGFFESGQRKEVMAAFVISFALGMGNLLVFFFRRKQGNQKEGDEKESEEEGI